MELKFYKYQGTGNDFVVIDNRDLLFDNKNFDLVRKLCNRRFGIGADGLILIQNHPDYDFEMVYYNADASQSMCGNGSRCAIHFANFLGIIKEKTHFLAIDGPHDAMIKDGLVHLKMNDVEQVTCMAQDLFINTGSPHYVAFVEDIDNYNVFQEGRKIRNSEPFGKAGTNVNFVKITNGNEIFVRTYERGVEDETLSCGTGVTAASLAASYQQLKSPVKVKTLGGELQVAFEKKENDQFKNIFLIGPAQMVFEGIIHI
jgi:diaminopimelate epimerase